MNLKLKFEPCECGCNGRVAYKLGLGFRITRNGDGQYLSANPTYTLRRGTNHSVGATTQHSTLQEAVEEAQRLWDLYFTGETADPLKEQS